MTITASSPILELEHEGEDHLLEYEEEAYFNLFCFKWRRKNHNEHRYLLNQNEGEQNGESWLVKKLKKVKEVSEVIPRPKWKTFIRRISGHLKKKKKKKKKKNMNYQFQYDAGSYALNFDGGFEREDYGLVPNFSSRSTAPLVDHDIPANGSL